MPNIPKTCYLDVNGSIPPVSVKMQVLMTRIGLTAYITDNPAQLRIQWRPW